MNMNRKITPKPGAELSIVNVGYLSTNYWVISAGRTRLLFDLGYPGTMGKMRANLLRMGIPLNEIHYALASHYHIDHAGLGQELKNTGVRLLVLENQVSCISMMKRFTKPQDHYVEIIPDGNLVIGPADSRLLLANMGIAGQVVTTPGHSEDSISLLLDGGAVFTGDLTPLEHTGLDYDPVVTASWKRLAELGARQVYPAHGPVRPMFQFA